MSDDPALPHTRQSPPGAILAIDFGPRRVGFARSDPDQRLAFGLDTLIGPRERSLFSRQGAHPMLEARLRKLFEEEPVALVLIGDPRHESGEAGDASARVRRLGAWIGRTFRLPVRYWDEYGTTIAAAESLIDATRHVRRAPGVKDRLAAQHLLQSFLDAERMPRNNAGNDR